MRKIKNINQGHAEIPDNIPQKGPDNDDGKKCR